MDGLSFGLNGSMTFLSCMWSFIVTSLLTFAMNSWLITPRLKLIFEKMTAIGAKKPMRLVIIPPEADSKSRKLKAVKEMIYSSVYFITMPRYIISPVDFVVSLTWFIFEPAIGLKA